MSDFKKITAEELTANPFKLIGKDWMLITAGDKEKFNTMTASWGGVGIMWGKPVATAYIRPQRYTFEFIENGDYYTQSFFDEEYRDALKFCGSKSGRDYDKVKETGLTPVVDDETGAVYFKEAKVVFICKKMYAQFLNEESALTEDVTKWYNGDYHKMYMSEIVSVLVKE
ncbi:flavin reductase [Anaeromassilibacillus sp. An172]|uniref:flavin reductase family protein n=1 Tax=Anaeromassilibacillus sp. An172 TaxID=1965570 RepID=UPI000B36EE0D|nr:flavin reductase [Anaeromassilibacillus sp. An172]OUP79439.1 flavin reductase [Anaeromassilibacillus sp. An172]